MGTVTITSPAANAESGDATTITINAQPAPGERADEMRLTFEELSSSASYNQLVTGIGEVVPLGNGLRLFLAVGQPDDQYFRPDGNNARIRACPYEQNMPHQRGTFPERLQTRLPNDFQVQSSIQTPWVTQLVDTEDRGWDGTRFNGQPGTDFPL